MSVYDRYDTDFGPETKLKVILKPLSPIFGIPVLSELNNYHYLPMYNRYHEDTSPDPGSLYIWSIPRILFSSIFSAASMRLDEKVSEESGIAKWAIVDADWEPASTKRQARRVAS